MNFSKEWENQFSNPASAQISRWPWSDLVTHVMRHARPTGPEFRVLELGCGSGANVPFFKFLGCDYYAIEGSQSAVSMLQAAHKDWAGRFAQADFTKDLHFPGPFDLIVDRGSLTHNSTAAIRHCIGLVKAALKPGGKYIAIDWFSTRGADYKRGKEGPDAYTRVDITEGGLAHVGAVHFSDEAHILDLFQDFDVTHLSHKEIDYIRPEPGRDALWNFVAVKKA